MDELLDKGQETCGLKAEESKPTAAPAVRRRGPARRPRGKRQLPIRDILKAVREVGNAVRGDGQKGSSLMDIYNEFQESLKSLVEGKGGPLDESLTQIAKFMGFNVSNSLDIIPTLFMKAFTDTTVSYSVRSSHLNFDLRVADWAVAMWPVFYPTMFG